MLRGYDNATRNSQPLTQRASPPPQDIVKITEKRYQPPTDAEQDAEEELEYGESRRRTTPGVVSPPDNWFQTLVMWSGCVGEQIWFRVLIVFIESCILNIMTQSGVVLPVYSSVPHSLVGLAIGLLLVFRTNTACAFFFNFNNLCYASAPRECLHSHLVVQRPCPRRSIAFELHPLISCSSTCDPRDRCPHSLILIHSTDDRYYEGRKCWERFQLNGRILSRMLGTCNLEHRTGDKFTNLYYAFVVSVKHRLRGEPNSDEELADYAAILLPDTVDLLLRVNNRPLALCRLMSDFLLDKIENGELNEKMHGLLQARITDNIDAACACERIVNTPIPVPYSVQMRQMLVMYVCTIPVVFEGLFRNWISILGSFVVSFGFFGTRAIGVILNCFEPCAFR